MDTSISSLDKRLTQELVTYITKEMEHGYSIDALREVLLNFEKNKDVVDAAITEVLSKNIKTIKRKQMHHVTDGEILYDLISVLRRYIEDQKKRGYSIEHIREALINFGHHEKTIDAAISVVNGGQLGQKDAPGIEINLDSARRIIFPFAILSFAIILYLFAKFLNDSFLRMTVLFFPVILSIFCAKLFLPNAENKNLLFAFPVAWTGLFYIFGYLFPSFFQTIELNNVTALNLVFSLIYFYILYIATVDEDEPKESDERIKKFNERMNEEVKSEVKMPDKDAPVHPPLSARLKHIELNNDKK
jgi:hypothetical protein